LRDLSLFADHPADALELVDHLLIEVQDVVERVGDFASDPGLIHRHPCGKVSFLEGNQGSEQNIGLVDLRSVLGGCRGSHAALSPG
jgi:hypothetical protein